MLIVAATPIGNLGDASPRLRQALEQADIIVAEDTRVAKSLVKALHLTTQARFVSANEHTESSVTTEVLEAAKDSMVLLVSDAGMPLVSDPGYVLVSAAREQGIAVSVIPGPSAGLSALAVSGLPTDRFVHEGFIPKKGRTHYLENLALEHRTMVFFESPHRLAQTLRDMALVWGADRPACVVRELTKMFEEVAWGTLSELETRFSGPVKGEIVVVVHGAPATEWTLDEAVAAVMRAVSEGTQLSTACAMVAKTSGIPKRELYQASVAASA